ncbi:hypothetical protein OH77DRAFT_1151578 [Trametes cingulata]|nr:hypothetical protein OH77DRAFT_1151578 [Trametes cingulata]
MSPPDRRLPRRPSPELLVPGLPEPELHASVCPAPRSTYTSSCACAGSQVCHSVVPLANSARSCQHQYLFRVSVSLLDVAAARGSKLACQLIIARRTPETCVLIAILAYAYHAMTIVANAGRSSYVSVLCHRVASYASALHRSRSACTTELYPTAVSQTHTTASRTYVLAPPLSLWTLLPPSQAHHGIPTDHSA